MKTIEDIVFDIIEDEVFYSRDEVVMMLERMAEEQREIDAHEMDFMSKRIVDKACEWLKGVVC